MRVIRYVNPVIPLALSVSSEYKLVVRRALDDAVTKESGWSKNLVVNNGLNFLGGSYSGNGLYGCVVGSGNNAPTAGDGSLQSYVAGTVTTQVAIATSVTTSPPSVLVTKTFRFATGVAAGNLSEVGIGIGNSNPPPSSGSAALSAAPLFSRALIVDTNGIPVTITVLSDEYLDVLWRFTIKAPVNDTTGVVTMTLLGVPTNINFVIRPGATMSGGWSWAPTDFFQIVPSGNSATYASTFFTGLIPDNYVNPNSRLSNSSQTGVDSTYVVNSFTRQFTLNANPNDANGTIDGVKFSLTLGAWNVSFSPSITKINTQVLSVTFGLTWSAA